MIHIERLRDWRISEKRHREEVFQTFIHPVEKRHNVLVRQHEPKICKIGPSSSRCTVLMQTFHCYNTAVVIAMYMLVRREKKQNKRVSTTVQNVLNQQKVIFLRPLYRLNALCELFISIL